MLEEVPWVTMQRNQCPELPAGLPEELGGTVCKGWWKQGEQSLGRGWNIAWLKLSLRNGKERFPKCSTVFFSFFIKTSD